MKNSGKMDVRFLLDSLYKAKKRVCIVLDNASRFSETQVPREAVHLVNECNDFLNRVNDLIGYGWVSDQQVRGQGDNTTNSNSGNGELHPLPDDNNEEDTDSVNIEKSRDNDIDKPIKCKESTPPIDQKPIVNCSVVEDDFSNFDFDAFMDIDQDHDGASSSDKSLKEKNEETENVSILSHQSSSSRKDESVVEIDGWSDDEENEVLLGMDESYDLDEAESPENNNETTLQEIAIAEAKHIQQEKDGRESNQPQDPKYTNVLKRNFGYAKFRPLQWDIIKSVLEDKRDNFVIMSTGYGKSLTFQFPSVFTKRCSVIISPLISLMEDQALALQASSIEACVLGSSQRNTAKIKEEMYTGKYRLIYITPESAENYLDVFIRLDRDVGIDLFAIDEAHCVSQWGNDFRPAYRKLHVLKQKFPKVPVIAVTATATRRVQVDIIHNLKLRNPNITRTSFDRPNLFLGVNKKSNNPVSDLKKLMKQKGLRYEFEGPTIIYCPTIKATELLKNVLDDIKVSCGLYHAKLSLSSRQECHKAFLNDEIQVVVATVAFGMGIDKPDVRQVIHYGAPKEIETYYQEIGRAGRDGMPSVCTVVYSDSDFFTIKHMINNSTNETFREHKYNMFQKMKQYLTTVDCRRRILLSHFEPGNVDDLGGFQQCCDCCKKRYLMEKSGVTEEEIKVDYSKEANNLLKAVEVTGNIYGLAVPVLVLMGSVSKKVVRFKDCVLHGIGKSRTEKFWKALGHCLMVAGYLKEERMNNCFGDSVKTTAKALAWMKKYRSDSNDSKIDISPSDDLMTADTNLSKKPTFISESQHRSKFDASQLSRFNLVSSASTKLTPGSSTQAAPPPPPPPVDPRVAALEKDLYLKLLQVRDEIFKETGFTPHSIASNKMLLDMAKIRPSNQSNLLNLEDFSQVKVERFGQKFLALIKSYCKDNSLDMDNFPENITDNEWKENEDLKTKIYNLTTTQQESYQLFVLSNNSLEDVASKRGLKTSTIVSHLSDAILAGLDVDIKRLGVSQHYKDLITSTIRGHPINGDISSLTSIKDRLPSHVEYNHVKLVIAELTQLHGKELNSNGKWILNRPKSESTLLSVPPSPSQSLKRSGSDLFPSPGSSPPLHKMSKSLSTPSPPASLSSNPSRNATAAKSSTLQPSSSPPDQDVSRDSQSSQTMSQSQSLGTQSKGRSLPGWMQAAAGSSRIPRT